VGWLRLVGSLKLEVSFAKEPYKKNDFLQKRPIILRSLLIVATPYYIHCKAWLKSWLLRMENNDLKIYDLKIINFSNFQIIIINLWFGRRRRWVARPQPLRGCGSSCLRKLKSRYAHVDVNIHIRIRIRIRTRMHVHSYTYTYTYLRIRIHTFTYKYTYTCMHMHMYNVCICTCTYTFTHAHTHARTHTHTHKHTDSQVDQKLFWSIWLFWSTWLPMGWLRLVCSFKLQVSFAKEPYKRDDILQKRPIILRRLLIVATP